MSVYRNYKIRNSAAIEAEAEFGLSCIEPLCLTLRADSYLWWCSQPRHQNHIWRQAKLEPS